MLGVLNFLSNISDAGTLVIVICVAVYFAFIAGRITKQLDNINKQLDNHIPTRMDKLEDNQKEMRKESKEDIKALNQKVDQNYKDMTTQNNQNFKELVNLITKQRTG